MPARKSVVFAFITAAKHALQEVELDDDQHVKTVQTIDLGVRVEWPSDNAGPTDFIALP